MNDAARLIGNVNVQFKELGSERATRRFAGLSACYVLSVNTVPPTMHELYAPPHSVVP